LIFLHLFLFYICEINLSFREGEINFVNIKQRVELFVIEQFDNVPMRIRHAVAQRGSENRET